jgi:peptidoglycan hydrolase-like protein with peptidoglycan-binding domain
VSTRLWTIGGGILIVAILALGYMLGVSPLLTQAATADADRTAAEQQNLVHEAALVELRAQAEQIEDLEVQLASLHEALPTDLDSAGFLDFLQGAAGTAGVSVSSVTIAEPAMYGASGDGTVPAVEVDPALNNRLFTSAVSVTVDGDAGRVLALADALRTGDRLFFEETVAYTAGGEAGGTGTITGYIFVVTEEPLVVTEAGATTETAPAE